MMNASKAIAFKRALNSLNWLDVSTRPGGGALEEEQLFLCPTSSDMQKHTHVSVTKTAN
jgi:hypothetical protein